MNIALNDTRKPITNDQRNSMMYLIESDCFILNDINQSEKSKHLLDLNYLLIFIF